MHIIRHPRERRGSAELDWLSTKYSFSFSNWYDPERMGFGALRVINDDRIAAGAGFPPHGHRDMEIITLVTSGSLTHQDSLGNTGTVGAGEVQVMSAGTGVVHSEYNASSTDPLELFQLWIETGTLGAQPRYDQRSIPGSNESGIHTLVAPLPAIAAQELGTEQALGIHQDAYISSAVLAPDESHTYQLKNPAHGVYILATSGSLSVNDLVLRDRDAAGFVPGDAPPAVLTLTATVPARALLIEVPMIGEVG